MKYVPMIFIFIFGFVHSFFTYAENDSLEQPAFKIILNGSLAITTGWEPEEGKLYSDDWYDRSKVNDRSLGYHYGVLVSKRIASSYFLVSGLELSLSKLSKFRTKPAPDPRYSLVIYDTSYYGYKLKSFQIPLYVQIPIFAKRTYLSVKAGVVNDFTYSEKYYGEFREIHKTGYTYGADRIFNNSKVNFTGTRIRIGFDAEFRNPGSRIILLFGTSYLSPPVSSGSAREYALHYSSVFSFTMGFGYCFCKKNTLQQTIN